MTDHSLNYGTIQSDPVQNFTGNCENIIGFTPVPLGLAGPVNFVVNDLPLQGQIPLATTEAALVASVNRGAKALRESGRAVQVSVKEIGITRSLAFAVSEGFDLNSFETQLASDLETLNEKLKSQSRFTKLKRFETKFRTNILYINLYFTTGQAMGMNMATIAAKFLSKNYFEPKFDLRLITVSANWCSDKKPSQHTKDHGRKFSLKVSGTIPKKVVQDVLKTTPESIIRVSEVKLGNGSKLAGSLGSNAHHANIVAASFIALGQDTAHVVEGSLGDSFFTANQDGDLEVRLKIPALVCGSVGGGTSLSVQKQTLALTSLPINNGGHIESAQLAGLIGSGVLAGELSLMAALAADSLAESHGKLRREI